MNEEELIRNINTYLRSKALYQHTIKKKNFHAHLLQNYYKNLLQMFE